MSPHVHSDSSSNRSEKTTVSDLTNYRSDPRQAAHRPASYPDRDSNISHHNHRHQAQHNQDSGEDIYERGQFHQLSCQHMSERTYRNRVSRHHQHTTPPHRQHAIIPYRSQHRNQHPRHLPTPPQRHRRHPQPRQGHRQHRSPSPVSRGKPFGGTLILILAESSTTPVCAPMTINAMPMDEFEPEPHRMSNEEDTRSHRHHRRNRSHSPQSHRGCQDAQSHHYEQDLHYYPSNESTSTVEQQGSGQRSDQWILRLK